MNAGAYSATFRMAKSQADILESVTDNLANSATPGHRRTIAIEGRFDAFLARARNAAPNARMVSPDSMAIDFSPGAYRVTGNALDMAVNGNGFFVVEKDGVEYYTRNGSFRRDPDGTLLSQGGLPVVGESGPLRIPADADLATLTVDSERMLRAGDKTVGQLKLASFADPGVLNRAGPTLFAAPAGVSPQPDRASSIANRTLEGSNSSVFEELTELITCSRANEACQRMIKAQDETEGKTISGFTR